MKYDRQQAIDDIKANYANYNAEYFAKKYGVKLNVIYCIASKYKVTAPSLWEHQKDQIIKDYHIMPIKKLCAKYGHDMTNMKIHLKKWGVELRTPSESKQKYKINQDYFKYIDTPEKAYWLGFIYADGCIIKNKESYTNSLSIGLAKKDAPHLQKFLNAISSPRPIYYYQNNASIIIKNINIVNDLTLKGLTPKKSLTIQFPSEEAVPNKLIRYFILGYFDGDGTISYNKSNKAWSFGIISTIDFVNMCAKILQNIGVTHTKISLEKRSGNGKIGSLVYGGTASSNRRTDNFIKIYNFLYSEKFKIFLNRKKKIFDLIYQDTFYA